MYKIKTRGGAVLYVAQDAADIREALKEAVSSGVNLSGANLGGANLNGANLSGANLGGANLNGVNLREANLRGAYLSGAYLSGANLREANLRGAYLGGANLGEANLRGADLGEANLSGANLSGANLRGANLNGANLGGAYLGGANLGGANLNGAIWTQVAAQLQIALHAMNDGGRHWIKGALNKGLEDGSTAYCSVGSIEAHSEGTVRSVSLCLLTSVAGGSIESFNDDPSTTWEDIQTVFSVAIKHAQRFATQL